VLETIVARLDEAVADESVRVVVIGSEGRHFSAGATLQRGRDIDFDEEAGVIYQHAARILRCPKLMIASVQGAAVGGGLGLALAADFRIGSPEARFIPNYSRLGFYPGFATTVTLPWIVGAQRSYELLCTGRTVLGDEALRIGLLDRLVDADSLATETRQFAAELASRAPLTINALRTRLRSQKLAGLDDAIDHEARTQSQMRATSDFREGVKATRERRAPNFTGH
jgi:enoyl-CoA hydratase/carnithine racemase